jgi:hypothetical protein
VPTTRPRHTITETPPVHAALERLRAHLREERIDFAELLILGADAKARRLRSEQAEEEAAERRLAETARGGSAAGAVPAAGDDTHLKRLPTMREWLERVSRRERVESSMSSSEAIRLERERAPL